MYISQRSVIVSCSLFVKEAKADSSALSMTDITFIAYMFVLFNKFRLENGKDFSPPSLSLWGIYFFVKFSVLSIDNTDIEEYDIRRLAKANLKIEPWVSIC